MVFVLFDILCLVDDTHRIKVQRVVTIICSDSVCAIILNCVLQAHN